MEQHPPSPGVGMNFPPPEHKAGPGPPGPGDDARSQLSRQRGQAGLMTGRRQRPGPARLAVHVLPQWRRRRRWRPGPAGALGRVLIFSALTKYPDVCLTSLLRVGPQISVNVSYPPRTEKPGPL